MSAVEAIVIGAGLRGRAVYGAWARAHPERRRSGAGAAPAAGGPAALGEEHALADDARFDDWAPLLAAPRRADVAIVATGDTEHVAPALAALERGYHVLLEKPIAPDPESCVRVVEAAERAGRMLQIGHVLRYSAFYERAREIVAGGHLGRVLALDLREHVAHWHMCHSFVRGKFRRRSVAAPILLAKSCHDLDLLVWLAGTHPRRVASFGRRSHFRVENAPPGAPSRCTDGCPHAEDCVHDAVGFYLGPDEGIARLWPWSDVSADPSREARRRALETGPYGRCVYRTDNDVLDHQVVAVELEGGATASFAVQGLASHERRTLRIAGTRGELRGVLQEGRLEVTRHGSFDTERIDVPGSELGHFGGDEGLVAHFVDAVSRDDAGALRAAGRVALEGHLLGFAAERAREEGRVVSCRAYREQIEARVREARQADTDR